MANMLHPFDPSVNKPRPNADGSVSTELTRTVQIGGQWVNVPSLWWGAGSDVKDFGQMSDDQLAEFAGRYEAQTGQKFPRFPDLPTAELAAQGRSKAGGGESGGITSQPISPRRVFTIQSPDGRKIKIEAADQDTALRGAQEWAAANPGSQAPSGPAAEPPAGAKPGSKAYADWAMSRVKAGLPIPKVTDRPLDFGADTSIVGDINAGYTAALDAVPILGPKLKEGVMAAKGALYGVSPDQIAAEAAANERANPEAAMVGSVAGTVVPLLAAGGTTLGGRLLGNVGTFGQRLGMSAASGGVISAADTAARGGDAGETVRSLMAGGALGGLVPVLGAGIKAGTKAAAPLIDTFTNPVKEAGRRVASAFNRDVAGNPASVMNAADEAVAAANNIPLANVDRGGETVRALARSVANQSPESRAMLDKLASDRFSGQAGRAANFVKRIAGGNVDDLAYQQGLQDAARLSNAPRYRAAFDAPQAKAVWTQDLQELMQSVDFMKAVRGAEKRGTNRAAIAGFRAVKNPFTFTAGGKATFRVMPDGSRALPSLEFWNQVKINLDDMIGAAQRKGENALASELVQMKQKLVGSLDAAVPQYKAARAGAAAFFGAEDALDAGKMFANATRQLPEAKQAFAALNAAEQKAFRVGYASELVDKIKDARFRANVIDQAFGSPAKREMFETVFGKVDADKLEAYVRAEDLADKLRGALGNSTTARQLAEMGLGGIAGYGFSGGDLKAAFTGAVAAPAARYMAKRADAKVMEEIAKLLTSGDPAAIQKVIANASLSPKWLDSLRALERVAPNAAVPLAATREQPALAMAR